MCHTMIHHGVIRHLRGFLRLTVLERLKRTIDSLAMTTAAGCGSLANRICGARPQGSILGCKWNSSTRSTRNRWETQHQCALGRGTIGHETGQRQIGAAARWQQQQWWF